MSEEISPLENHNWWMKQLRKDAKANRPDALRLADELDVGEISYTGMCKAAAELRRLHAQRDALLEALNKLEYSSDGYIKRYPEESEVNAVIKKAEGA
jgi:hypothetical protein